MTKVNHGNATIRPILSRNIRLMCSIWSRVKPFVEFNRENVTKMSDIEQDTWQVSNYPITPGNGPLSSIWLIEEAIRPSMLRCAISIALSNGRLSFPALCQLRSLWPIVLTAERRPFPGNELS